MLAKHASAGEIDVPEAEGTVSWADVQRDQSGWLGNVMQWAYYTTLRRLEPFIKEADDAEFLRFGVTSKQATTYTICSLQAADQEKFTPTSAHMNRPWMLLLLHKRCSMNLKPDLGLAILTANEPFLFYTGVGKEYYTGNDGLESERIR